MNLEKRPTKRLPVMRQHDMYLMYDTYPDCAVLARAAHYQGETLEESCHFIVGSSAIEQHVASLFEQYTSNQNIHTLIDIVYIRQTLPGNEYGQHIDRLSQDARELILTALGTSYREHVRSVCTHSMDVPELYEAIATEVLSRISVSKNLDATLADPIVEGFLLSYADNYLNPGGKIEALLRIINDLNYYHK